MSTAAPDSAFDVGGPLPTGVTVLEASAGTGKTYTIAGLAARYVAEGRRLDELLVVTFTRMATAELRDRVRERIVSAEHGLERALAGEPPPGGDVVMRVLAAGDPARVELRRRRLAAAIADFDAATIVTTHGFCQEVLGGLGIAGDLEPGFTFVEDLSDLREEVVDDLYVRAFHRPRAALRGRERPPFDRAEALEIARRADENPGAKLEPAAAERNSPPGLRRRFAAAVRTELELRKRRLGVMTYDDLLTRLCDALHEPRGGAAIAARLRDRYGIVLVDEFQDTDPLQWRIVRRAFAEGDGTLVLIGDPKQAIYAFRGADVYAYLDAAASAGASRTLDTNWRSDQPLLSAYDSLFGDAQLGHPGIAYRRVGAAPANVAPRLSGAPHPAPLRVRLVPRDAPGAPAPGAFLPVAFAREHIAEDLASDVVALLDAGARIEDRRADGTRCGPPRTVQPGDVAVLVRRNLDAEAVRHALARAGVPAVLSGAGSVFATRAAGEWLTLLEALERPSGTSRVHAVALTAFVGWPAHRVASSGDDEWDELQSELHRWSGALRTGGVAALVETISVSRGMTERVLAVSDGERRLTDLRHLGELLHAAAMTEQLGPAALTTWLRHRIRAAASELAGEERTRRLESDAAAVQVLTIHRSKGLEFPIVYLPYLWDPSPVPRAGRPVTFHEEAADYERRVDVGLEGPDYRRHRERSIVEQRGEDLRLMYVGLTRARHQAVLWWAGTRESGSSALARLVFHRGPDGAVPHAGPYTPRDDVAMQRFEALAARAPGCIAVERALPGAPASWSPPLEEAAVLAASTFERRLDREWRRTSYSDITAGVHDPRVASEPEEDMLSDEPETGAAAAPPADDGHGDALRAVPLVLSGMPGGVRVGTFVHDVLEATDFAAADLDGELMGHVRRVRARRHVELGEPAVVAGGLRAAIETPLGPLVGGLRLRDVTRADRLDELAFELPLAGGDAAAGQVTPAAIGASLLRHLSPGDPLAGYAERLADPALRHAVRGYLTGSIDLVLRTGGADGAPRFAVVDYKTNRLGAVDEEITAWHHRPAALAAEMRRSHYVLQALLYTVALHRYLRWRLAGYDPARNLAGVLYLFVRGMIGPDTPVVGDSPCGVFSWRPPDALVLELSDLLDRGARG